MNIDYDAIGLDYMGRYYSYGFSFRKSVKLTLKGNEQELVRIVTTLTIIDFSNNMFDIEIPQVISELNSLKGLNLSHNKITGPIPQSLANLTNLECLDLSSNRLTGEIPPALVNLNFLEVLDLSKNKLVGVIPKGKQFDTFSKDSYKRNIGLCGSPLSKACDHVEGKLPQLASSTNDKFEFCWKPVALGYGCGMVFGMFME
ncbi:receptor-like protein 9DC3 [Prosopis cineraria]|uniref:receptor-like protein 9DC3 n=1 Tax=Prosopis cineraria TaxID=364024 RepID=UPI00240F90D0|nr:receptor-like protein 9DC3 [Prosopis cineraria]